MKAEPPSDSAAVPVRTTSSTWRSAAVNPDTEAVASVRKDIDGQEARDRDLFAVCCLLFAVCSPDRERGRGRGRGRLEKETETGESSLLSQFLGFFT
jgi:hypothetical protein